jgi:hypothetical protein
MNTPSSLGAESYKFINPRQRLASFHKVAKCAVVGFRFVRAFQKYDQVGLARGQIACLFNFVSRPFKFLAEIPDEIHDFDVLHIWQANRWLGDESLDAAGNRYVKAQHFEVALDVMV